MRSSVIQPISPPSPQRRARSRSRTGSRAWRAVAVWLVVLCSLLQAEPSGQTPTSSPSSVHFYVCPSIELSQPDRAVLATLNDDLSSAVARAGGVVFASTRRGGAAPPAAACATVDEIVSALQQYGSAPTKPAISVLLDSPALGNLLRRQPDLVRDLRLRVMNLRLFTRPLRIFENEEASKQNPNSPNVGVYADQEIAAETLKPLLSRVLKRPVEAIEVVPFQNIAEMARCLAQGQFTASRSRCPLQISWAAIVEQDASLTVEDFERAYGDNTNKRPPKSFVPDGLSPGIYVNASGLLIVPPPASVPALPSPGPSLSTGASMAAVPRTDGPVLVEQQARETPPEPAGYLATLWTRLPSVVTQAQAASPDADGVRLKHPYPIVLTNQDAPDSQLRSVLSDSYVRVLNNSAIGSPCSAVAERLHRAYLFNAHLDNPSDPSKRMGLGSELALATGRGRSLTELFNRLGLSPDIKQWPKNLAAAGGPPPACPVIPNERFPKVRLDFAGAGLTSQFRAMEHLRRGNLDGAAACLRVALAESAVPNCHKAERSTYSIYYNPYFYFAVQQVTGGRAPR